MGTLKDGCWLSTTAIETLLMTLPCRNAKVYDASFMRLNDVEWMKEKASCKRWPNVRSFFPTNHDGNHWTLIVIDPRAAEIALYSSLPNPVYEREFRAAAQDWGSFLPERVEVGSWAVRVMDCPAQTSSHDCGISVIVCATYRILDLALPSSIDFALWRRVLHAVVAGSLPAPQQPLDEPTVPAPTASTAVEHNAAQLDGASKLQAGFDLHEKLKEQAQRQHGMAMDVISLLEALLNENQRCFEESVAPREKHQKALNDYSQMLSTLHGFDTQHEAVRNALEASVSFERRQVREHENYQQRLQQHRRGWNAGLAACRREERFQADSIQSAKKIMGEMLQGVQALQKYHAERARSAEKLSLEWTEKLRAV